MDNLPSFGGGNVDFNASCYPASTNGINNSATGDVVVVVANP